MHPNTLGVWPVIAPHAAPGPPCAPTPRGLPGPILHDLFRSARAVPARPGGFTIALPTRAFRWHCCGPACSASRPARRPRGGCGPLPLSSTRFRGGTLLWRGRGLGVHPSGRLRSRARSCPALRAHLSPQHRRRSRTSALRRRSSRPPQCGPVQPHVHEHLRALGPARILLLPLRRRLHHPPRGGWRAPPVEL